MRKSKAQLLAEKYKLKFWLERVHDGLWARCWIDGPIKSSVTATSVEVALWKVFTKANKNAADTHGKSFRSGYDKGWESCEADDMNNGDGR